ncbi:MAG: Fe-S cluster assembly protein IscX [Phycisphaerales bacterium]|jgi:FeS assembly protein IscX|nr:Fe-S cluster assembly protein IscX [Phycisphaerales bacterium]
MPALKWTDADEIGFELSEKFPDLDPLKVRFTDMHKMAAELPDFTDTPEASSEGILEAIQMAWLEYSQED